MKKIHGHRPGLNTPVAAQRSRYIDKLGVLDADVQVLIATAKRIRSGLTDAHRESRNPVAQQTNEEWLHAYDGADVAQRPGVLS